MVNGNIKYVLYNPKQELQAFAKARGTRYNEQELKYVAFEFDKPVPKNIEPIAYDPKFGRKAALSAGLNYASYDPETRIIRQVRNHSERTKSKIYIPIVNGLYQRDSDGRWVKWTVDVRKARLFTHKAAKELLGPILNDKTYLLRVDDEGSAYRVKTRRNLKDLQK